MATEKIEHEITGKGYTKKEARQDAIEQANQLAEQLEGDLTQNPKRGSEVEIAEPVKPSATVEKSETLKFVNEYYLTDDQGNELTNSDGERIVGDKVSAVKTAAKDIALQSGQEVMIRQRKKVVGDNLYAAVTPDMGSVGEYKFIFTETQVLEEEEAEESEEELEAETA